MSEMGWQLFGGPFGQASLGIFRAPETNVVMPGRRTP